MSDDTTHVLSMWTIYDHPKDHPDFWVGRCHVVDKHGSRPTDRLITARTLDSLRELMRRRGLARLPRDPKDDPKIVEVWL